MFGEQALHPIEYVEHDWTQRALDRRAARRRSTRPARWCEFGSAIRTPFGRVHWAGTETSTYWTGYMDGAVRAGERAAVEVLDSCCEARSLARRCSLGALAPSRSVAPAAARPRAGGTPGASRRCRRPATRRTSTSTPTAACTPARYATRGGTHAVAGLRVERRRHAAAVLDGARPGPRRGPRRPGGQPDPRRAGWSLLETSTVDGAHPRHRAPAGSGARSRRSPTAPCPNYATWGPGGALFVTDYAAGVIWKVPHGRGRRRAGSRSPALDGASSSAPPASCFRPSTRDLLITQQTTLDGGGAAPTRATSTGCRSGATAARARSRRCGPRSPADLPDGFGIGRGPGTSTSRCAGLDQPARRARPPTGDRGRALPRRAAHRRQRLAGAVRHPLQRDLPRHQRAGRQPVRDRRRRHPPGDPGRRGRREGSTSVPASAAFLGG